MSLFYTVVSLSHANHQVFIGCLCTVPARPAIKRCFSEFSGARECNCSLAELKVEETDTLIEWVYTSFLHGFMHLLHHVQRVSVCIMELATKVIPLKLGCRGLSLF